MRVMYHAAIYVLPALVFGIVLSVGLRSIGSLFNAVFEKLFQ
jgi:hypothetical protein